MVFVSAYIDSEIVYAAIGGGARGYLSKDATRQQICDAIAAVARGGTVFAAEVQTGLAHEIQLRSADPDVVLTAREREILELTAQGLLAPEIGAPAVPQPGHGQDTPTAALRQARRVGPRRRRRRGDAPRPAGVSRAGRGRARRRARAGGGPSGHLPRRAAGHAPGARGPRCSTGCWPLGSGYARADARRGAAGAGARRLARSVYPAVDVALLTSLTYTSGGAFSQLRLAFFVLPVAAAFLMSAPATALWSALSVGSYLAVSLTHPATDRGEDFEFVLSRLLYLAWMGLAAVLLATILTHRKRRVEELATARGRLLTEVLGAEERERKRLAEALHDETIQDLLAAGQDLDEARGGDEAALRRAREEVRSSVAQLRTTIADLHPFVLEHAGLEAALRSLVDRRRQRGAALEPVRRRDAVGEHDRLVVSVARELIANAAKHADAGEVNVRLRRAGGEIVVEVADDGPGLDRRGPGGPSPRVTWGSRRAPSVFRRPAGASS